MQKSCNKTEKRKEHTKLTPYYIIGKGKKRKTQGDSERGPCGEPQGTVGEAIGERKERDRGRTNTQMRTDEDAIGEVESERAFGKMMLNAR